MKTAEDRLTLAKEWLEALQSPKNELTIWEVKFTQSVAEQIEIKEFVTEKQLNIIERIYTDRT